MLNGLKQITLDGTVKILYRWNGGTMNYKFNEDTEYLQTTYSNTLMVLIR